MKKLFLVLCVVCLLAGCVTTPMICPPDNVVVDYVDPSGNATPLRLEKGYFDTPEGWMTWDDFYKWYEDRGMEHLLRDFDVEDGKKKCGEDDCT